MIRAVIFDLDGTLLNTVDSLEAAGSAMLDDLGLARQSAEAYKYFAGDGADVLVQRALIAAGDTELSNYEKARELYRSYFAKTCNYHVQPYDGIPQALAALKEKGILLAVLSNKPHRQTVEVIRKYFGDALFSAVRGQSDEVPKKPDPTGARIIMRELGVSPEECLYVGDTGVDMQTGCAAGAYTVGVLWGFRPKEELAEHSARTIIEQPVELVQLAETV